MAKSQKRTSREAKKPKQAPKPAPQSSLLNAAPGKATSGTGTRKR